MIVRPGSLLWTLPATLRYLDSQGDGHHLGHQPAQKLVAAEVGNTEIAIMPLSFLTTFGQLAQR